MTGEQPDILVKLAFQDGRKIEIHTIKPLNINNIRSNIALCDSILQECGACESTLACFPIWFPEPPVIAKTTFQFAFATAAIISLETEKSAILE
jgi:hypothetical protein